MIGNAIEHTHGPQPVAAHFEVGDKAQHRYQWNDCGVGVVIDVCIIDNPNPTPHSLPAYQRIEVQYVGQEIRSLEAAAWQFDKV